VQTFTNFNADAEGITIEEIIRLLEAVQEPSEADYR